MRFQILKKSIYHLLDEITKFVTEISQIEYNMEALHNLIYNSSHNYLEQTQSMTQYEAGNRFYVQNNSRIGKTCAHVPILMLICSVSAWMEHTYLFS